MSPNLAAFLSMISHSEGTDRAPDPYRVCYGFTHTIADLSDHPAITGEWMGESLANLGPAYSGLVSTAAGRYQLIRGTWRTCKNILHLPDFTGPSQDAAAAELIREAGALALVNDGRIGDAISNCRHVWASLPGSDVGQPTRTFADLMGAYTKAGGAFA